MGSSAQGKLHELPVDQSMDLEHSTFEPSSRGKLSALQRQESCLFNLSIGQDTSLSCSLILQHSSFLPMSCVRDKGSTVKTELFLGSDRPWKAAGSRVRVHVVANN